LAEGMWAECAYESRPATLSVIHIDAKTCGQQPDQDWGGAVQAGG
jgi:hypothetical protein